MNELELMYLLVLFMIVNPKTELLLHIVLLFKHVWFGRRGNGYCYFNVIFLNLLSSIHIINPLSPFSLLLSSSLSPPPFPSLKLIGKETHEGIRIFKEEKRRKE